MCSDCSDGRELEELREENERLVGEVVSLRAELEITDRLLAAHNELLNKFECPQHGECVPYAIEQVGHLRAENEKLQAEVQTFADAWNELETLQAKVAVLEKEKASWGNEFTAVYMAKERIEELKKALRFCRDNNFKIEKTQEVARNALLSSALEKVNANYSGVLGSLVDENFNRSDGRELEELREENERLNGLALYQCDQHPDLPKSYVCALCMQNDCFALRDNERERLRAELSSKSVTDDNKKFGLRKQRDELKALLREASKFVMCHRDCPASPCDCGAKGLETRIDAALEEK